jgi:hypothetical protein
MPLSPVKSRNQIPLMIGRSPVKRRASLRMSDLFGSSGSSTRRGSLSSVVSDASQLTMDASQQWNTMDGSTSSAVVVVEEEEDEDVLSDSFASLSPSQANQSMRSHGTARSLQSSHSGGGSLVQRLFCSDAPRRLDSKLIVAVSNSWARVKHKQGYEDDVGEAILLAMMDRQPATRRRLRITSSRAPRFGHVCRMLVDVMDVVVTLLGPDLDDEDLQEIGARCRAEGIDLPLLAQCVAVGIQNAGVVSKRHWSKEVAQAWDETFAMLLPSMMAEHPAQQS